MQTPDDVRGNIEKIMVLFPNCVTETADNDGKTRLSVDFERLRQELSDEAVDGREERYQMTWPGKRNVVLLANAPVNAALRPCREESVDFDTTRNLYIEGDNLDVLKCLKETYIGKVKMIYIDPPYNTGNDFVYHDDFASSIDEYMAQSGQYDEQGNRLVSNSESNGRFHTDWLNMIYPRLKVAKDLLTDDGVIFISIDENEVATLRLIADEIFGQRNFIAELVWAAGRKNDSKYISISHEYILAYFRNAEFIREHKIIWRERKQGLDDIYKKYESLKKKYNDDYKEIEEALRDWYKSLPDGHPAKDHSHYNNVDERGIFFPDNISWPGGGGPKYEILHPITHKPVKIPSRGWITSKEEMENWIKEGRVKFADDETGVPTLKSYLRDRETSVPYSVFYKDGRAASKRLASLMGDKVFENPKDEEIIKRLIEMCGTDDGDIILDFFSGSGTTAHAMFIADAEQNKQRRFILVQLREEIKIKRGASERTIRVAQNAIRLLDSLGKPHNICEIGKERIRRAGEKIREELKAKRNKGESAPTLDTGFRVLKLDTSNMKDVYYRPQDVSKNDLFNQVDNVKEDRSAEDLLFQAMLECGVTLDSPIEQEEIEGMTVYNVNHDYMLACFEAGVTDSVVTAIAKRQPQYALFRDATIADDSTVTNIDEIFKTYSNDTRRRVI